MAFGCKNHHRLGETENGKCPICKEEAFKLKLCKSCLLEKPERQFNENGICKECEKEEI